MVTSRVGESEFAKRILKTVMCCRPALLMNTRGDSNVSFTNFEKIIASIPSEEMSSSVDTMTRFVDEHFFTADFLALQQDSTYARAIKDFVQTIIDTAE